MGYSSTLQYLQAAAHAVLTDPLSGLLPHINAGVMDAAALHSMRGVSVSQGLMLESLSNDLLLPGQPHYNCPDKDPAARLAMLDAAGRQKIPFTTGILIGIGESRQDRIDALRAIRDSHTRYGHIQEVIIQNFRAKKGTLMENAPEPSLDDFLWTIAVARLVLGAEMSIQAPPNLTPDHDDATHHGIDNNGDNTSITIATGKSKSRSSSSSSWSLLLDAGINDFGGVSPITKDFVNPEKPWPHLDALRSVTEESGKILIPRLPVYPQYLSREWLDDWKHSVHSMNGVQNSPLARTLSSSDVHGYSRASSWRAGLGDVTVINDDAGHHNTRGGIRIPSLQKESSRAVPLPRKRSWMVQMTERGVLSTLSLPLAIKKKEREWKHDISIDENEYGMNNDTSKNMTIIQKVITQSMTTRLDSFPSSDNDTKQRAADHVTPPINSDFLLSEDEVATLFLARGNDFDLVVSAADKLRQAIQTSSNTENQVTYVVNRNINYTNICTYTCRFCAFSKGPSARDEQELRGAPYLLSLEEVSRRTAEAWDRGATEVCMQGGIHPEFTGTTYLQLLEAAKKGAPDIHVHAFSPLEVLHGSVTLGMTPHGYLRMLRDAGLGSLPGTAAEILDDTVRAELCPDKLSTQQWLEIIETAHDVGLKTTSTIMFGHIDSVRSWARHLIALRDIQRRTNGFSEFVPLPFVAQEAPIYRQGKSRAGPTLHESILMHAVSRIALYPYIQNIQASWVKMGPDRAAGLLGAGCNDMGGVLMNESITRAAGAKYGQELCEEEMKRLIIEAGKVPVQRSTLYGVPKTKAC